MADNVPITAGSGTTVSTDDCGAAGHVQRVKVAYGADGDATQVGADANGLDVDVTRLPAIPTGANTIGKVDQGTGGASAWKVDGSAVTQPVSLASVPTVTEKQDQPAGTSATWTSATSVNTALTTATTGYGTANVSITVPSTVTAGVITLEVSNDGGTTYYPAGAVRVDNGVQENVVTLALSPGLALNRMYAVSVDAMTQVRARLSTVITGSGNVVVTLTIVAGGIEPFVAVRARKVPTYRAVVRTATRAYQLSNAFTANTRKQFATIHHASTATKTVRLRKVLVSVTNNSAVTQLGVELVRITAAPATGNPAITPSKTDSSIVAAEATCLALPTTAGTEEAQPASFTYGNLGITGAQSTANPISLMTWYDMLQLAPGVSYDDEATLPVIRAGVLEGWAVTLDSTGASTVQAMIVIEFTEEAP